MHGTATEGRRRDQFGGFTFGQSMTSMPQGDLGSSEWVHREPGLAAASAALAGALDAEQVSIDRRAASLARPGLIPPLRATRHLASLTAARWRWQYGRLPSDLLAGRPLSEPSAYLKGAVAQMFRDHLAGLGPPAAEMARIIGQGDGLLPGVIVDEVRRRSISVPPMPSATVRRIAARAFGTGVQTIEPSPITATAVSQIHRATLTGSRRSVLLRVRRPGVDRALRSDLRILSTLLGPFEVLLPSLRGPHPLGFVELTARQSLEEADLRNEAMNAVELAVAAEHLGLDSLSIPHPVPGLIAPLAIAFEDLGVTPITEGTIGHEALLSAYLGVALESGLSHGVFHADLDPENLAVTETGNLTILGFGTVGRLAIEMRRGAIKYLVSIFSGDVEGQVEAMKMIGAVPDGSDLEDLARDLGASEALRPMRILTGGPDAIVAALKEGVRILLHHRLRPPVVVTLFVRNVFMLNAFIRQVGPDASLMTALMPLVQRLPHLAAELDLDPR